MTPSFSPNPKAETLVGGAPVSTETLQKALTLAPVLTAADGGADCVLQAGLTPTRVTGDLDSIGPAARAAFADVIREISEQDSTDFAKALRSSDAPYIIGVGFIGAQVDHFLACLSELGRRRAAAPVVLLSEADCVCVLPPEASLTLPVGTRLSLWPLGQTRGRSTGLQWPIDGIGFDPQGRVGTSNRTTAPEVTLSLEGAPMVLILPSDAVEAMLAMLEIAPRGRPGGDV